MKQKELLAAVAALIGPDSLLREKATGKCYCDEPDEAIGESGTIECEPCRARREIKPLAALLFGLKGARARGE